MFEKVDTKVNGAYLLKPKIFRDERGSFFEGWNKKTFDVLSINENFVQDNFSVSSKNVLRGLHYQVGKSAQGKLVSVSRGTVFDVFVDLRVHSPTYGKWDCCVLTDESNERIWIPPGCAHGFLVLSDVADFTYKCTNYYNFRDDRSLIWNDATLKIDWPIDNLTVPILSEKDSKASTFDQCEKC